jgi:hypothetical protein
MEQSRSRGEGKETEGGVCILAESQPSLSLVSFPATESVRR